MQGVSEKRRRACAELLGFDRNATYFNKRSVQNSVAELLHNAFGLNDAGGFVRNYEERLARGDRHPHHGDLDNDPVQFHRILGYGADLGVPNEHYDEEIARRADTRFGAFNADESSDEEEEEESDSTQDQAATVTPPVVSPGLAEAGLQEAQSENAEDEEAVEEVAVAEEVVDEVAVAEELVAEDEDEEVVEEDEDEGSHSQSSKRKQHQEGGSSKSGSRGSREIADLRKSAAHVVFSQRNADYFSKQRGGCPRESDLGPRDKSLKINDYIIRTSARSQSGNGDNNGRGTADLRECDSVITPMKIDDFAELKASWEKNSEWLRNEAEETGCFSSDETTNFYISYMSYYPLAVVDEFENHCGLKALGSLFRPPSHSPSVSEDSVLQSTIIKTPVFRFLVNNVVEVSVCDD